MDGVLVATNGGAPGRAVYGGRVINADWLPGMAAGPSLIMGDGYMSLYGAKTRGSTSGGGERVSAGDTRVRQVTAGGASNRPELYFEISKAGKQWTNTWFKAPLSPDWARLGRGRYALLCRDAARD